MVNKRWFHLGGGIVLAAAVVLGFPADKARADWPMVAGNALRTSYTSTSVTGSLHVEWYRPVEAFIPPNSQIIAANSRIYVSTARGLYTMDAATGAILWKFDTELPLGNSPTYANEVLYVGGYDRKLYALNAATGAVIWTFTGAKAGYDTNPVVADGKVMLGNRDGNFYAVNTSNGTLAWSYTTGGPINYSAAYKNGVIYFASMDNYGYALNSSTGALVWKTAQMLGDGFYSYWPVIYTNPTDSADYIVFVTSNGYRAFDRPGGESLNVQTLCGGYQWCEWYDEYSGNVSGNLATTASGQSWSGSKTVYDYSKLMDYLSEPTTTEATNDPNGKTRYHDKPWRRLYYIYAAASGSEYSMTYNGKKTYVPVDPYLSNSGSPYPPIANGSDGLLWFGNHYEPGGYSRIAGWRMGTPYMVFANLSVGAGDEPNALSFGGTTLYRSIAIDRVADYIDVSGSAQGTLWDYSTTLGVVASGFDADVWCPDSSRWGSGNYDGLHCNWGGRNGVYWEHGDQNPLVPYNGRLYSFHSNSIIVYGTGTARGNLGKIAANTSPANTGTSVALSDLKSRLATEISKMVSNWQSTGKFLRPGYYNAGQFNNASDAYLQLNDYFYDPAETLMALSAAYPYIDDTTLKASLKSYLDSYYQTYFVSGPYKSTGWSEGNGREWAPIQREVLADLGNFGRSGTADKYAIYGLWKYYQNLYSGNATKLAEVKAVANKITGVNSNFGDVYDSNRNTAGTVGLAGLNGTSTTVSSCSWFSEASPFTSVSGYTQRTLNLARNFMFLTPEVGNCMSSNSTAVAAIGRFNNIGPYWLSSRYTASLAESTTQNLYDTTMFLGRAYILKETREKLTKWLDVPAFKLGDLFYVRNVVAAIEAPSDGSPTATPAPTVTSGPTATPAATATPTPTPATSGPPGGTSGWTLTFSDEFGGSSVDTTKWATQYLFNTTNDAGRNNGNRSLNDEMEWYVDNADVMSGGILSLKAGSSCATTNISGYSQFNCSTWPYTSGMIASFPSFSQRYGYFEARMKIPSGQGLWPAFWLMPMPSTLPTVPAAESLAIWPPEIDIMENKGRDPTTVYLTNIYCSVSPYIGISNSWCGNSVNYDQGTYTGVNYSAGYHNFGIDWEPGYIDWYVDGVRQRRVTTGLPPEATGTFSGKMFVIANLALGGAFSDGYLPVASTLSTKSLDIDYIRVYQKGASTTPVVVPGDANADSHVDGLDYVIWLNNYGGSGSGVSKGDFNSDGKTDGLDYVIWLNNYGK